MSTSRLPRMVIACSVQLMAPAIGGVKSKRAPLWSDSFAAPNIVVDVDVDRIFKRPACVRFRLQMNNVSDCGDNLALSRLLH